MKQEAELSLGKLQAGDRAEFARLVDAYSEPVYRLALKILNDPQDAEDVLQETFLKALRSVSGFEGRSSLSTWLYRIAANEALMLVRKRKPQAALREEVDEEDAEDLANAVTVVDWCCLPEKELLSNEARRFLDAAVQKLPLTLRMVFLLRDVEGLSIRETAEALSLTEMTVKTRLLRARLRLREELSGYYGVQVAAAQQAAKVQDE